MATPEGKHNCFLLNFFKGATETSSEQPTPNEPESLEATGSAQGSEPVDSSSATLGDVDNVGNAGDGDQVISEKPEEPEEPENLPEELLADPVAFMAQLPTKYDEQWEALSSVESLFDDEAIQEKTFVDARDAQRKELTELDVIAAGRAAFAENDQADRFADTFSYSGLQGMEENNLTSARLAEQPWSDDYWAMYLGMLGHRYADVNFPKSKDWKVNISIAMTQHSHKNPDT
ncbi:MAG: hypothetical protein D3916_11980, partial [Candidatus Electrothrix sp. MAN1_4]|nr:hypothetical protein [Candidatus Electrothrix sp. MAN1_4]